MSTTIPKLVLPEPDFVPRDPDRVVADMTLQWETLTEKKLYPAQVEYLQMNLTAYREILCRIAIQEAAKQNLVNFARYPALDYLGELVGCDRLLPSNATTVLVFSQEEPSLIEVLIPKGTKVGAGDLTFTTDVDCSIPMGELEVAVTATAIQPGPSFNDIPVDLINSIISPGFSSLSVRNSIATRGGLDIETDDRYRQRIKLASNQFSAAGPRGAYEYYVKSVRSDIIDVGLETLAGGRVRVYPLLDSGVPDQPLLLQVFQALNDEDVRPLTDTVEVLAPNQVDYDIQMKVKLFLGVAQTTVIPQVQAALEEFGAGIQRGLGRDLVPSQWIEVAQSIPGVYSCQLEEFDEVILLGVGDWPKLGSVTLEFDGYAAG